MWVSEMPVIIIFSISIIFFKYYVMFNLFIICVRVRIINSVNDLDQWLAIPFWTLGPHSKIKKVSWVVSDKNKNLLI